MNYGRLIGKHQKQNARSDFQEQKGRFIGFLILPEKDSNGDQGFTVCLLQPEDVRMLPSEKTHCASVSGRDSTSASPSSNGIQKRAVERASPLPEWGVRIETDRKPFAGIRVSG